MLRPRAKLSPLATHARARTGVAQLLATALVLAAVVLFGAQGFAAAASVAQRSVATLHDGAQPHLVDGAPLRVEVPLKRDHSLLDLPFVPPVPAHRVRYTLRGQ